MLLQNTRELYVSANGDRWDVGRDRGGKLVVLHRPNRASGGNISAMDIGMFLAAGQHGPEHQALMRLLRTGDLDTSISIATDHEGAD
jgi:hypothetical protein